MSRKGLTREQLVAEAALLADEVGLEKLSLSVLADRLEVRSPSLYNHVDGLAGLRRELSLLAANTLADLVAKAAHRRKGKNALVAMGDAFRNLSKNRPGLYASLIQAPAPGDTEMADAANRALEPLFGVLSELGCEGDQAIHAIRSLRSAVHGFALLEAAGGFGLPTDLDKSFHWMIGRLVP